MAFASLFQLLRIGGRFVVSEIPLFEMSEHNFYPHKNPEERQCLVGSLTGEVDSYNATELHNGWLITDGNRDDSVMV